MRSDGQLSVQSVSKAPYTKLAIPKPMSQIILKNALYFLLYIFVDLWSKFQKHSFQKNVTHFGN